MFQPKRRLDFESRSMSDNDTSSHGRDMAIVPLSIILKAITGYLLRRGFLQAFCDDIALCGLQISVGPFPRLNISLKTLSPTS